MVLTYNYITHRLQLGTGQEHIKKSFTLQFLDQLLDEKPLHPDHLVLTHLFELTLIANLCSCLCLSLNLFPLRKNVGWINVHLLQDCHELAVQLLSLS